DLRRLHHGLAAAPSYRKPAERARSAARWYAAGVDELFAGAFTARLAIAPFAAVTVLLVALALAVATTRGNPLIRGPLLVVAVFGVIYAGGSTLALGCDDPATAERLYRFAIAGVS